MYKRNYGKFGEKRTKFYEQNLWSRNLEGPFPYAGVRPHLLGTSILVLHIAMSISLGNGRGTKTVVAPSNKRRSVPKISYFAQQIAADEGTPYNLSIGKKTIPSLSQPAPRSRKAPPAALWLSYFRH